MIHFNPDTRTFNLLLQTSYYAFQVDQAGRVVHLGWGPRPANAAQDDLIAGEVATRTYEVWASFITQFRPDEILTFGDVTSYGYTLKASFPSLPVPLQAGEALHLPIRDLRLRYVDHEIVTDPSSGSGRGARPGLSPTHGLPVKEIGPRETLRVRLKDPVQDLLRHAMLSPDAGARHHRALVRVTQRGTRHRFVRGLLLCVAAPAQRHERIDVRQRQLGAGIHDAA